MKQRPDQFDVIGIGFGPANIALAIAMEEARFPYRVKFLEKQREETAVWQKEMLLEYSDIQNHPLRDLVTPRNPRSRYTFVNYLFENNRLFEHLNLGMHYPYRVEYAQYISWVARHFRHQVQYNCCIDQVRAVQDSERGGFCISDKEGNEYYSSCLVLAPGRTPYIPAIFRQLSTSHVCHLVNYLQSVKKLIEKKPNPRICVVGGSQSAVEIILHLSEFCPDAKITGMLRNFGYRLKDASPFTGEVYFPEFVDFYYQASPGERQRLTKDLYYTNYSAVDGDVLDQLYRKIYLQKLTGQERIAIHRLTDICDAKSIDGEATLSFRKLETRQLEHQPFDLVILATGFRNLGTAENEEPYPAILEGLSSFLQIDPQSGLSVGPDYKIILNDDMPANAGCYLNGLCENSHGMGDAGSLSLLALRSQVILDSIKKQFPFHIPEQVGQTFFEH